MIEILVRFGSWFVFAVALLILLPTTRRVELRSSFALISMAILWIFAIQGDSIILGPRSRLEWGDGEMLFLGYFPYLAEASHGKFLHNFAGGVDRYAVGRIGGELISARTILSSFLPSWFLVVFMRVAVTSIALASVYLFSRQRFNCSPVVSFALGALFSAGFDVNVSMTFLYGPAIAAVPLLFYFLVTLDGRLSRWLIFILFSIIYISFVDPFYWLPAVWLIGILLPTWHHPDKWAGYFGGIAIFSALWVLNYSEAITAVLQLAPYSSRPEDIFHAGFLSRLWHHAAWLFTPQFGFNRGGWAFFLPLVFALYAAIRCRNIRVLWAAISVLLIAFSTPFLKSVPWRDLGLNVFVSYRWYFEYFAFPMAFLVAAFASAALDKYYAKHNLKDYKADRRLFVAVCIAAGCAILFVYKTNIVAHMATRGNLTVLQGIPNLLNADWHVGDDRRVIGLPSRYVRNTSASYGLPSFDGDATFIPRTTFEFWRDLVLTTDDEMNWARPGFPTSYEYNLCCEPYAIDKDVSIDMLRVANVGYILSYRQLQSDQLTQVSGPARQPKLNILERILSPAGPIFVYALPDPLPRVYRARSVTIIGVESSKDSYLEAIRANAPARGAVIRQNFATFTHNQSVGEGSDLKYQIVPDGIDITPDDGAGGLFLVNVPPLPWWQAFDEKGNSLVSGAANLNQIAISVPNGVKEVRLRYARPSLIQQLVQ